MLLKTIENIRLRHVKIDLENKKNVNQDKKLRRAKHANSYDLQIFIRKRREKAESHSNEKQNESKYCRFGNAFHHLIHSTVREPINVDNENHKY